MLPITDRCSGRCAMCGVWRSEPRADMEPDFLRRLARSEHLLSGIRHVNITGGEPLLHGEFSSFASILGDSFQQLREVTISTSGLNVAEMDQLSPFRERLPEDVHLNLVISMDGVGELHGRIRGVDCAWEKAVESLDRALVIADTFDALAVSINCTISRENHDAIGPAIQFARDRGTAISLTYAATNDLYLRNDGPKHGGFRLVDAEKEALAHYLRGLLGDESFPVTQRHFLRMLCGMLRGEPRSSPCVHQSMGVFLDLDGSVYPCGTAGHLRYGKLPDEPFSVIYRGREGRRIRRDLLAHVCPSCPSNSYYGLADDVWLEVLQTQRSGR